MLRFTWNSDIIINASSILQCFSSISTVALRAIQGESGHRCSKCRIGANLCLKFGFFQIFLIKQFLIFFSIFSTCSDLWMTSSNFGLILTPLPPFWVLPSNNPIYLLWTIRYRSQILPISICQNCLYFCRNWEKNGVTWAIY